MSTLSTLVVKLVGDIGGFTKSMDDAEGRAESAGSSLASKLGGGLATIGKAAVGLAAAGLVTLTTVVTGSLVATTNWANQLDDLSDVLGTTANESAGLVVALKPFGEAAADLPGQVGKLVMSLKDAKGGLSDTGKYMQSLGIQFQDSNGKLLPTTQLLTNIANRISQMPDGLDKTQAMMTLFGKSGKGMSDALNAMANGGLDAAMQKAQAFGLAIGDDGVNNAMAMQKGLADLDLAGQGLAVSLGSQLLPVIVPLIQQFVQLAITALPQVRAGIDQVAAALAPFITLITSLITGLAGGGDPFGVITNGVYTLLTALGMAPGEAAKWSAGIGSFVADAIALFQQVVEWVQANWPAVQAVINQVLQAVANNVNTYVIPMVQTLVAQFQKIVAWVQANWPLIQAAVTTVMNAIVTQITDAMTIIGPIVDFTFNAIKTSIGIAVDLILGIVKTAMQLLTGDWKGAWETIRATVESVWNGIKSIFGGIVSDVIRLGGDIVNGIANGIRNAASSVLSALSNVVNDAINNVKNALGIHSPSALFAGYGENMMLGMARGIARAGDLPAVELQGVVSGVSAAGSRSTAGGQAVGQRVAYITINVLPGADARAVQDGTMRAINAAGLVVTA